MHSKPEHEVYLALGGAGNKREVGESKEKGKRFWPR